MENNELEFFATTHKGIVLIIDATWPLCAFDLAQMKDEISSLYSSTGLVVKSRKEKQKHESVFR